MTQIIIAINPDPEHHEQCATYCEGVFLDLDGCCSWTDDHEFRGPLCLAAERKLAALVEAIRHVAFIGSSPSMVGGSDEYFYRGQLHECIAVAANALVAIN